MHWIDFASPHSVREAVDLLNDADGKCTRFGREGPTCWSNYGEAGSMT